MGRGILPLGRRRDIYPSGHKMDDAYLDHFRPLAEQRVRQAAWRLTQVLAETLR